MEFLFVFTESFSFCSNVHPARIDVVFAKSLNFSRSCHWVGPAAGAR